MWGMLGQVAVDEFWRKDPFWHSVLVRRATHRDPPYFLVYAMARNRWTWWCTGWMCGLCVSG